ncbi:MAG: hypothetical protein SCALA702_27720 [Melioribacteraceae bacterium]|nr:MAG: hypothetical protein SCALA702_27720 [Melioribacteraceae bacterium]
MAFKFSELDKKQRSRLYTTLFFVAVVIFFIVNNISGEEAEGPYPPDYRADAPKVETKAPNFTLLNMEGETVSLSDFSGKVVIIDFWATWCGPCRKGVPDLVKLKEDYAEKGVEVIGISLDGITRDGSTVDDIVPFMKEYNINYPIVQGTNKIVQDYGNIISIPTSFIIDQKGNIVSRYDQLVPHSVYETVINKLLESEQR